MNKTTETYRKTARVWVYMADRILNRDESTQLQDQARDFVVEWAAHGKDLNAYAEVRHDQFLILMVDEERHMASGCSIDSSVHFVQQAGESLGVDFFNRMQLAYRDDNGKILTASLSAIQSLIEEGKINSSTIIFNNLVNTKQELDETWETAISASPYARWL